MPRSKRQKTTHDENSNNMGSSTHAWADLTAQLEQAIPKANEIAQTDGQLKAFTTTNAVNEPTTFGIKSAGNDNCITATVNNGKCDIGTGKPKDCAFILSALPEQWQEFMKQTPVSPYQSYWGMFGMNIKQEGIEIQGDKYQFSRWTHVWRRVLEILHDALVGPTPADEEDLPNEDHIVGRYVYTNSPGYGRAKVFYEQSGEGDQNILFLHTAGADSRQYHGVMNDPRTMKKLRMTAVDLPAHGRSFPYENYWPGTHTHDEERYVSFIAAFIKKIGLKDPIVCGASMAGQVSLACAIHADRVGCIGTIPMQGSDHLDMERQWDDRSPYINQSLYNPEWIYGMMSPTSPMANRQLVWHLYSAQAYGIFHGDLDFYFGGWDGRSRMKDIDTKKCPVYMLTGEYDWSNTPAMSQATADKIPGGKHQAMEGLGHFPATENPKKFVGYLLQAVDHIQKTRQA